MLYVFKGYVYLEWKIKSPHDNDNCVLFTCYMYCSVIFDFKWPTSTFWVHGHWIFCLEIEEKSLKLRLLWLLWSLWFNFFSCNNNTNCQTF